MTFRFTSPVTLTAAAGQPRRLAIVAYSGGVMKIAGFGPVVIDLAGVAFDTSLPILADHENSLAGVIGTGTPATDGQTLTVSAALADTPAAATVFTLLAAGVALQASVGADPTERRQVAAGREVNLNGRALAGPFTLVTRSVVREVTITPLGADGSTSVSLAARRLKGFRMSFENWIASLGVDPANLSDDQKAELQRAYDALYPEPRPGDDTPPADAPTNSAAVVQLLAGHTDLQVRAVTEWWPVARAQQEALARLRAARGTGPSVMVPSGPTITAKAIEAALLIKASHRFEAAAVKEYGEPATETGRRLAKGTLLDLVKASFVLSGRAAPHDTDDMIRASFSGGDISTILGNTANKIAEMTWREAEPTWKYLAAVRSTKNFKTNTGLRPSFAGNLTPLPQGGEIDHGSIGEETYTYRVNSYAKMYTIDR